MQNLADLLCMDFQVKKKHMDEVLSGPFLWELAPCGANANNEHGELRPQTMTSWSPHSGTIKVYLKEALGIRERGGGRQFSL